MGGPDVTQTHSAAHGRSQEEQLQRSVTGRLLFFYVLGDVLGSGIYALIGIMAFEVGGALWMSFVVGVSIALLRGFAYAELITKHPQAAGASLYVHKAFGRRPLTFLVTFCLLAATIAAAGALSLTFGGEYFAEFIEGVEPKVIAIVFIAALLLYTAIDGTINREPGEPAPLLYCGVMLAVGVGLYFVNNLFTKGDPEPMTEEALES
jgi:amino acid transporter